MMRYPALLLLIWVAALSLKGQEKEESGIKILFQGVVFDSKTLGTLPNSQVSVNRRFSSVSDMDGSFALYVNVWDTVRFSRLGYKPESMVISDTLVGKQYLAGIFMNSDTLSIGEVVIVPRMANLRSEIMNAKVKTSPEMEYARHNVAVSAYQGRNTTGKLVDPASNYELLRQRQKVDAFERGGIPSDRILGLSPFMLIPAAYLLLKGLPEKAPPLKPDVSDYELDRIIKEYLKNK